LIEHILAKQGGNINR